MSATLNSSHGWSFAKWSDNLKAVFVNAENRVAVQRNGRLHMMLTVQGSAGGWNIVPALSSSLALKTLQ